MKIKSLVFAISMVAAFAISSTPLCSEPEHAPIPDASIPESSSPVHNQSRIVERDWDYETFTNYNMQSYFENLWEYSPENDYGSCGFVSLINVLTYYDTFFNDNIIPEQYERTYEKNNSFSESIIHSPGVLRNSVISSGYVRPYLFCHAFEESDYQAYLMIRWNEHEKTDNDESKVEKMEDGSYANVYDFKVKLDLSDQDVLCEYIGLDDYLNFRLITGQSNELYEIAAEYIGNGVPVIAHIVKRNERDPKFKETNHAAVAYEVENGVIYANYGWDEEDTHLKLIDDFPAYNAIKSLMVITPKEGVQHVHSDNYDINGKGCCGCNIDDKIYVSNIPDYKDIPPTYYWMKDAFSDSELYEIRVSKRYLSDDSYLKFSTTRNSFSMPISIWKQMCNTGGSYYVELERTNIGEDVETYGRSIYGTASKDNMKIIEKAASAFPLGNEYSSITFPRPILLETNFGGLGSKSYSATLLTKRARYNEVEGTIQLSANKIGQGEAYLDLTMSQSISRVDLGLCIPTLTEGYSNSPDSGCSLKVEYKAAGGEFKEAYDLLKQEYNDLMSGDKNYAIVFPEPTKQFRIISEFESPTSSEDKGVVSIDKLSFYYA